MDFDYLEDNRPRIQVQSASLLNNPDDGDTSSGGGGGRGEAHKWQAGACVSIAIVLLGVAAMAVAGSNQQLLLAWLALSLLIGPFAPRSITGGDCRVGHGELLPHLAPPSPEKTDKALLGSNKIARKSRPVAVTRVENEVANSEKAVPGLVGGDEDGEGSDTEGENEDAGVLEMVEDGDWTDVEMELLRKQMARIPRGTMRRWQLISEAFGGSRSVKDVVAMSKRLAEKKLGQNSSSYDQLLAQRKRSDQTILSPLSLREDSFSSNGEVGDGGHKMLSGIKGPAPSGEVGEGGDQTLAGIRVSGMPKLAPNVASLQQSSEKNKKGEWSENEDKALLSALKVFPKDTPLRWEKVAEAVPGRSKGQCLKRFSELKENFRSMKAENKSTNENRIA